MTDLSKAFDTINHNLLIGKLDAYGIHGVELSWFSNYLSERRQRVILDGKHSDWTELTKGVPQGFILGPMLFLLFVNYLSDVVEHCIVNLYADDTTIYSTGENPVVLGTRMEKDLERVANWIRMNGLKMNVAKTQLMVLTRKGKYHMVDDVEVKIGDTCLEKQNCVNYLGVKIDRDLSWKTHINHLHRQCMAKLAVIRRASCYLPQKVRGLLYQAFVLPHVDYCSIVWNHCGVMLRDRVERIQKYALRIIHRKPPRTSSEPLRRALGRRQPLRKDDTKLWYAWSIGVYLTKLLHSCAHSSDQTQP